MHFQDECSELAALFDALPSSLPEKPPNSLLPPTLDPEFLSSEGLWAAFNQAMHRSFGDKSQGLKITERGEGLKKTHELIFRCLSEFSDRPTAELVKLWIDALKKAATEAGAIKGSSFGLATSRSKRPPRPNRELELRNAIGGANLKARAQQIANPPRKQYISSDGQPWVANKEVDPEDVASGEDGLHQEDSSSQDDDEYEHSITEDSEDEDEMNVDNEELAELLPRKVDTSVGRNKARSALKQAQKAIEDTIPKKKKRKSKGKIPLDTVDSITGEPRSVKKMKVVETCTTEPSAEVDPNAPITGKCRPPIYHFFEEVDKDEKGKRDEGAKYYKCYHGDRKILKVTKEMNGSQTGLIHHLRHFPAMYQLWEAVKNRPDKRPTLRELQLAANKIAVDSEQATAYIKTLGAQGGPIVDAFKRQSIAKELEFNPKEAEQRLMQWLVASNQPFEEVNQPEFKEYIQYLRPSLSLPSSTTVKRRVMDMCDGAIEDLKKFISELESNVSLSLDAWTSSNGYAFMGIVMHYVSNDWKLDECLVDFRELIGEHSGENMASAVYGTISSLGLKEKIMSIVMDNASNNDTLLKHLSASLARDGIPFNPAYARGRCLPHIVHLAALELLVGIGAMSKHDLRSTEINYQGLVVTPLSESDDDAIGLNEDIEDDYQTTLNPVEKLRKIVKAVRASPQRRQEWLEEISSLRHDNEGNLQEISKMLILDVRTRWTSTHQMCRRALHYRKEINSYTAKHKELRCYEMTPAEWDAISVITDWLLIFRQATVSMSATRQPMLSSTHATLKGLQDKLKTELAKLPRTTSPELVSALIAAHTKLGQYLFKIDASPYPVWASLLDPRINATGFLADYIEEPELKGEIDIRKQELIDFYNSNYADKVQVVVQTSQPKPSPHIARDFSFNDRYIRRPLATRNEIEEYFKLPPEDWVSTDPIQWWAARKAQFPNLSRLARNILSIPGSAVAVERVFSGGRDTISLRRARLKPETIHALMVVKHKIRLNRTEK